jgi:hypothetical protein
MPSGESVMTVAFYLLEPVADWKPELFRPKVFLSSFSTFDLFVAPGCSARCVVWPEHSPPCLKVRDCFGGFYQTLCSQ